MSCPGRLTKEIAWTETGSGMGNCCGCKGDPGHETVLVRHKFAWTKTDRVIFGIDRYMFPTPFCSVWEMRCSMALMFII